MISTAPWCALNLVHSALFILANLGEWSGRAGYLLSFAARAPRLYLAERKDRRLLNQVLFESFQGVSRDRLFSLGEEYCERVLMRNLYPRAVEMFERQPRRRTRTGAGHRLARLYRRAARAPSRRQITSPPIGW